MATTDTTVTIVPYFKAHQGKLGELKGLCDSFVDRTTTEPARLYYGFSFDGDEMHCREGYKDAAGLLAHLDNVGDLLQQALSISDLTRLEVHGPSPSWRSCASRSQGSGRGTSCSSTASAGSAV